MEGTLVVMMASVVAVYIMAVGIAIKDLVMMGTILEAVDDVVILAAITICLQISTL